jgi:hypothetical protein
MARFIAKNYFKNSMQQLANLYHIGTRPRISLMYPSVEP